MQRRHPASILAEALIRQYLTIHGYQECLEELNKISPITPESDTSIDELYESLQINPTLLPTTFPSVIESFCSKHCLPELVDTYEQSLLLKTPKESPMPKNISELPQGSVPNIPPPVAVLPPVTHQSTLPPVQSSVKKPEVSHSVPAPPPSEPPKKVEPAPSKPAEPAPVKPAEPAPVKPAEPAPVKPTEPPKPAEPAPAKPAEPIPPPPTNETTYTAPDGTTFTDRTQYRRYLFKNYYSYSNKTNETLRKNPGEIDGQQFALSNITGCTIELLDHINTINCDDIKDSTVYFGPISESIFFRNCENCTFYVAAKQIRTRDCVNCIIFAYAMTEPVIETSHHIQFAPYLLSYPKLRDQAKSANLDPSNNVWNQVFDFNKGDQNIPFYHWKLLEINKYESKIINIEGLGTPENPFSSTAHTFHQDTSMKSFSIDTTMEQAQAEVDKE